MDPVIGAFNFVPEISENFYCHRNYIHLILLWQSGKRSLHCLVPLLCLQWLRAFIHPKVVPGIDEHYSSPFDPLQLLVLLWLVIEDHDNLFIMAESVHFLGIGLLIYKLMTKKNAGGGSLFLLPCHLTWRMPARSAIKACGTS